MVGLIVKIDTRDFERRVKQFARLGKNISPALSRAINHTGSIARTEVVRVLEKQTGLSRREIVGAIKSIPASPGRLAYEIVGRGGYVSLAHFGARQEALGVSAAPWGKRRIFPHTFIVSKPGGNVVFAREGKGRLPIHKLWGPAIPKEMVKDQSKAIFEATVANDLPRRIEKEIMSILTGAAPS
jgi:hypothetical protein